MQDCFARNQVMLRIQFEDNNTIETIEIQEVF